MGADLMQQRLDELFDWLALFVTFGGLLLVGSVLVKVALWWRGGK